MTERRDFHADTPRKTGLQEPRRGLGPQVQTVRVARCQRAAHAWARDASREISNGLTADQVSGRLVACAFASPSGGADFFVGDLV